MDNTYGYKPLSWELIELLRNGEPDFEKAEQLISQGADVNDQGDDKEENVLSSLIQDYYQSRWGNPEQKVCSDCEDDGCESCEHNLNPNMGESLLKIIKFFIDHGFDVNRQDGNYGRQCLNALVFTYDKCIIEATKMIFSAYGKNPIKWIKDEDSPVMWFSHEGDSLDMVHADHYLGNIYEATCSIFDAVEDGHPFMDIDSFEAAVGKKIIKVMAETETKDIFFPIKEHDNCFSCWLYFMYEGGYLLYTAYSNCWVNTYLSEEKLVDVSECFLPIINHTIKDITFGSTPETTFHFDNNVKLNIALYRGDEEHNYRYFYFE